MPVRQGSERSERGGAQPPPESSERSVEDEDSPRVSGARAPDKKGYRAFGYRDFRLFQAGRLFAVIGTQMQSVAIGWQVYETTRRPLDLGYVGLAQFLPGIGLSLVTGHVADRFDRRKILLLYQAVMAACSIALLTLSIRHAPIASIYAVLFVIGTARAFAGPASQALMPSIVPPEDFPNAVAWTSSTWQLATIVGPALGGFLFAGGPRVVYGTCAACFLLALALQSRMQVRTGRMEHAETSWRTLLAGVKYVWEKKVVLGAISLDLFAVLLGGAVALLPAFARDILHTGPWGLGLLRSAPALGAGVTALAIAYRPIERRAGMWMFLCVGIFGLATVGFGLSRNFALSLLCLVIVGASDMVSVVIRQVLVQLQTPASMRGRVSAVNLVFIGASNELGEFESGLTASLLGLIPAVVVGGIGTIVVVLVSALLFPELRKIDKPS